MKLFKRMLRGPNKPVGELASLNISNGLEGQQIDIDVVEFKEDDRHHPFLIRGTVQQALALAENLLLAVGRMASFMRDDGYVCVDVVSRTIFDSAVASRCAIKIAMMFTAREDRARAEYSISYSAGRRPPLSSQDAISDTDRAALALQHLDANKAGMPRASTLDDLDKSGADYYRRAVKAVLRTMSEGTP